MFDIQSPKEYRKIFEGVDNTVVLSQDKTAKREKLTSDAIAKMRRSKIEIHKKISFFSKIMLSLEFEPRWDIKTMCTNGTHVYFNPAFTMSLTDNECTFVVMHEMLHVIFLHFARLQGRDLEKWNYATDYAINLILEDREISNRITLKMPEGGLLDKKYANMSAEQIYDLQPVNPNKGKSQKDLNKNKDKSKDKGEKGDKGDKGDKSQSNDKSKDSSSNNKNSNEPTEGSYVKTDDGKFGKITSVNDDGTYDIDEVSAEEADQYIKGEIEI